MKTKTVFQTDRSGIFVGTTLADESPLEPGVFHIPGGCVALPPPACAEDEVARWVSDEWVKEKIQEEQPAPTVPVTRGSIEESRLLAYADPIVGSDRLFVEATRMQLTNETGFEAIRESAIARYREIQALFPWPEAEDKPKEPQE